MVRRQPSARVCAIAGAVVAQASTRMAKMVDSCLAFQRLFCSSSDINSKTNVARGYATTFSRPNRLIISRDDHKPTDRNVSLPQSPSPLRDSIQASLKRELKRINGEIHLEVQNAIRLSLPIESLCQKPESLARLGPRRNASKATRIILNSEFDTA